MTQDQILSQVETQTGIFLKIWRVYNVTTTFSEQDLLSANNPLYFSRSLESRTRECLAQNKIDHFEKQTGLSVLACEERFGLSGLTDHGTLSSPLHRAAFTTSDDISILRSLALLSIGRTHCAICTILVCQEQILQRPSLSCPGKKAVSNNLSTSMSTYHHASIAHRLDYFP